MPLSTSRRRFFRSATTLAAFGALRSLPAGPAGDRPNIIFLLCDDLNDSIEGMGGHPQARTPNIHRLASRGVSFTNCQNNQPWCAPSRASMWSGLYPFRSGYHGSGHWQKHPVLRDTVMLMEHLRDSGYGVFGTGKLFHNGHEVEEMYTEYKWPADFGPWPYDGKRRRELPEQAFVFETGYVKNLPRLFDAPHMQTFGPLSSVPAYPADNPTGAPGFDGWMLFNRPFRYESEDDRDLVPDELNAQYATAVLCRRHDRPFFLGVGFNRPHVPMYAPKKYFDMFPLDEIELPPYKSDDFRDLAHALYVGGDRKGHQNFRLWHAAGGERMWRQWVQAYLANVAMVDDMIGQVLDALEDSAYADNTVVFFTGDHGFHMGEKDWLFKNSLWEESARVPFIVSAPGVTPPGSQCEHPISLIDVYPTLTELCGLPATPNASRGGRPLDGYSIRPFLADPAGGEWDGPEIAVTQLGNDETGHFSARSRRYRYILCSNGEEELYDHADDPHEWTNLAGAANYAAIKARLKQELLAIIE